MKVNFKRIILFDLDGVLNTYSGNYDKNYIPAIRQEAFELIQELAKTYTIKIFTSRNLLLAAKWISDNNLESYIENVTNIKESSYLIIDDRCINFNGNYHELKEKINSFKPWYKN